MKKSFMLLAVAFLAFAGSAFAQNSATGTATASARIIAPISITKCGDLSFGNIIGSTAGGTVTVASTQGGTTTATYSDPTNMKPGNQVGTISNACFCVHGEQGFSYTETQSSPITVTNGAACSGVGCSNTMSIALLPPQVSGGQWAIGSNDGDAGTSGEASENETNCFNVGGTLTVGPTNGSHTQNIGNYTGNVVVTVAY
jgi:spore coat protein U-like protein